MILQKSFKYADLLLRKHFLLPSMLKTLVLLHIFVKTMHLFEIEIFCKIINVFNVSLDQLNTPFLNKSTVFISFKIHFY